MWDLSGAGIEPVSPVLVGRFFFTTDPPGKSLLRFLCTVEFPQSTLSVSSSENL